MSYILEALKISESERQQASSPPSIYSPKPRPPVAPEKDQKKSRLLLWCALAALVTLVSVAGYHLYGHKMISITITVPEENTGSGPQNAAAKVVPTPAPEAETTPEPPTSVPVIQPDSKKTLTAAATTAVETINRRPQVPRLAQLDPAFQNTVPEFKLAGHVYSEDESLRMILINDRIVRENGAAARDFILEEITPDGIILRNGTIRFRIDIP